jgi:hypothetical protein
LLLAGGAQASETTTPPYKKARSASAASADAQNSDNENDNVTNNQLMPVHF